MHEPVGPRRYVLQSISPRRRNLSCLMQRLWRVAVWQTGRPDRFLSSSAESEGIPDRTGPSVQGYEDGPVGVSRQVHSSCYLNAGHADSGLAGYS